MIPNLKNELMELKKETENKMARLRFIEKELADYERKVKAAAESVNENLGGAVIKEEFIKFFKKPYAIIPVKKNTIRVVVPKFIKGFEVGWLWKETESFFIYTLDHYSAWLGDIPEDLLKEIDFKQDIKAELVGNILTFEPSQKDKIKKAMGSHLADVTETTARVKRGHEFGLIVELVESNCLPFRMRTVSEADKRDVGRSGVKLRDYQEPALREFLKWGAVGLFHPTGSGKSFITLKCLELIKGPKLIIVPTRTLAEQWNYYIDQHIPNYKREITIATYQGFRVSDQEYAMVVFDECQRLPADTFSRLALINTKYRLGLSATPHREDGRESYIFALTGKPIGLNWSEYMKTVGRSYHPIYVHIVASMASKERKAYELLDSKKKTLIFCDSIDIGKRVSNYLNIPFIYGRSDNRLDTIKSNRHLVVSRVLDLGTSIRDLNHIIEIDFLFGSRQQELQRTGRLMHSLEKDIRHDIIMTQAEFDSYGKRLWSLQEKGFTLKFYGGRKK